MTTTRSHKASAANLVRGFSFNYAGLRGFPLHVVSPDPVQLSVDTDEFTREVVRLHETRRRNYLTSGDRTPFDSAPLYVVMSGTQAVLYVSKNGSVHVLGRGIPGVSQRTTDKYIDAGLALGNAYKIRTDWI